ncbi:MAG: ATP-binding cassette domain-containing protein [Crocinitomicaceae bacterium]|nr:ATP-binding cassette domain-containing protein [Crocinitomicaceae bacterium]
MNIALENIGKRYNKEWIFRGVSAEIESNSYWVIKGSNGSGKSTFLKIVSGFGIPTEGRIIVDQGKYDLTQLYKSISISAPYVDIPEEFTLDELVKFHSGFKGLKISENEDLNSAFNLPDVTGKLIKDYSSGMKQRVKLGLAIYSETPVLLLDEPLSNLDEKGMEWYQSIIKVNMRDRIILVCSNNFEKEFFFCEKEINIENHK